MDRQLVRNVGISLGWVYHKHVNWYGTASSGVNVARPYEVWNVPVVLTDSFDGKDVTVWTYPAQYAGSAFNGTKRVNAPSDRPDYYHSFEVALTKRFSSKWNAATSFWYTKKHEWILSTPTSANDDRFPIDETWNWEARADASYNFPWGIVASGLIRAASGNPGARTQNFSSPLLRQGTTTLRMEPFGSQRGPIVPVTSIRLAKRFNFTEQYRLEVNFSVFNLANSSAPVGTSYLSGATFGRPTSILSPRVARVGARITF
jgi:hypothetical protein